MQAETGRPNARLSRVGARILHTFEAGRPQTQPYRPVQREDTMARYASTWSRNLVFLIRLYQSDEPHAVQMLGYFRPHEGAVHTIESILDAVIALHERTQEPEENTTEAQQERVETAYRRLDAAVSRCSILLVRQSYGEHIYRSPIIDFCGFAAMTEAGNWMLAATYTTFLSQVIHCMQLWLLKHGLAQPLESELDSGVELDNLIRRECNRYLVNTTREPIAQLSYRRLLASKAKNDVVTHPVTTLSPHHDVTHHLHLSLPRDDWRAARQTLLAETTQLLEHGLLLGLHAAPYFPLDTLHDDVGDRRAGKCVLDNPRNGFDKVQDWLVNSIRADDRLCTQFIVE